MRRKKTAVQRVNIQGWTDGEILEAVKLDLEQLGLLEDPEGTLDYKLSIVLYTAAFLDTTDVVRLAEVTGYDADFIQKIADKMAFSKIWIDGHPDCEEWGDEKRGKLAFVFHELVAKGHFVRTDQFRDGLPLYAAVSAVGEETLQ